MYDAASAQPKRIPAIKMWAYAGALIADAKKTIQGGGGPNPELAMAGGKNAAGIDEALEQARAAAGIPLLSGS